MQKILILGGTGDAVKLAAKLATNPKLEVISSLAGRTKKPAALVGQVRIGGFGGAEGLARYIQDYSIDVLIDATHPCAGQITINGAIASHSVNIPYLMLTRPQWKKINGDNWIEVESVEAAARSIPESVNRVFITSGRQQLEPFLQRSHISPHIWYLMRSIDPPELELPNSKVLLDRGPFSLEQERQLLRDYRIQAIVSKNSGGNATYAKIVAARELGIPIIMVQRPAMPEGEKVTSIEAAIAWLNQIRKQRRTSKNSNK
ncbi:MULTISPECIES: cobalt-precorrin-6A reductase [Pseudanabaena]|jgi:precorrin-6A/cobalt-precorrin-6A reductase|uniref:cobalt-precorrin-6A reductase n=1 Tax=Pseudanabaena TaxID=1152 RepID=UPI00247A55CA|nr:MULTISPECIES: cobalt-precorrin-6A reductase [Pseudanabaena]MEA5488315.1 cobalt-precorrin-6A reductase [Pseudanabaena sp. CCNP1317]WGS72859.1 cobalt-precorrin-6A reductase [Pseudanabaena galeata CCNP1313]